MQPGNDGSRRILIRRCQIKIRRDPSFPGCIYSEMKMCLAPCFAGCTKQDYDAEVQRVVSFLGTSGGSLTAEIEKEREAASGSLDFERAASLHRRLAKVGDILRGLPEIARRIEDLNAVILQRAAEAQTIAVFTVRAGRIAEPFFLRFAEFASEPRSVEEILRAQLESPAEPGPPARQDLGEHLALVSRWYYSKPRDGEIFYRQRDWPYRRILRAKKERRRDDDVCDSGRNAPLRWEICQARGGRTFPGIAGALRRPRSFLARHRHIPRKSRRRHRCRIHGSRSRRGGKRNQRHRYRDQLPLPAQ